jgi:predicted peroxiredoxin
VCTQCAARRDIGAADVIDGVRIAGAQTFVEEALADDAQALVY